MISLKAMESHIITLIAVPPVLGQKKPVLSSNFCVWVLACVRICAFVCVRMAACVFALTSQLYFRLICL